MDTEAGFAFYVVLKYAAYVAWCYVGLRLAQKAARGERPAQAPAGNARRRAFVFGFVRLLIGIAFGFGIFMVGGMMHLNSPENSWPLYFGIYAPVRWVEWSIMAALLVRGGSFIEFLIGAGGGKMAAWQFGGIIVSHLADTPLILGSRGPHDMLPVGRFLC